MGANCCVAAKEKPLPGDAQVGVSTHRSIMHSPSWSFRCDNRTHIEDMIDGFTRLSHPHGRGVRPEVKSGAERENEGISIGDSLYVARLNTARNTKDGSTGYSVEVQVESLCWFQTLCSITASSERRSSTEEKCYLQLLLGFPSLLVPLANDNKDIRVAAVKCIEGLHKLWQHLDISRLKNGNDTILSRISTLTFADFLEAIFRQNKLISSDMNFLPSYLTSLLGSSASGLLVPENIHKR